MTTRPRPPAIIYGAGTLAALSLLWSAYAITDLMQSGPFGLSVAIAGDIGWVTVLWAEYRNVTLVGRNWAAPAAGWLIALAVAGLLVLHGIDADSTPQAIAGPFIVLVGKTVWTFALASMRDPAALTPEQEAEINTVIRDSEYTARLNRARSRAEIARIRDEAHVVIARDETDFEIGLERLDKQAELHRRTPLAITPSTRPTAPTEQPNTIGEHGRAQPNTAVNTVPSDPNNVRDQIANNPLNSANPVREQPSIADLVREQIAINPSNADAIRGVMTARPDANRDSVAAAVRRERRKIQPKDGYA